MKRIFTTIMLIGAVYVSRAQSPYQFNLSNQSYQDLTGATLVPEQDSWPAQDVTIPLGFNFTFFDHTVNEVTVVPISPSLALSSFDDEIAATSNNCVNRNLQTPTEHSVLSYNTSGSAGQRICKIEMKNFGAFSIQGTNAADYLNFQIWLYEGSNDVELHYGPSSFQDPYKVFPYGGPRAYLWYNGNNQDYYGCNVANNPQNPRFGQVPDTGYLYSFPVSGTVYKFSMGTTTINETAAGNFINIYPTTVANTITINSTDATINEVSITSLEGKQLVKQSALAENTYQVDVASLPPGMYIMQVMADNKRTIRKFIKQ